MNTPFRTFAPSSIVAGLLVTSTFGWQDAAVAPLPTAAAAPAIADPSSGLDLRTWPRDQLVDCRHMKLDIMMPTLEGETFDVVQTLTVRAIGVPVHEWSLDAVGFQVHSVTTAEGTPLDFSHSNNKLVVQFPDGMPTEFDTTVVTRYTVAHPEQGMIFAPAGPASPAQFHTQGQAESNRYWFPCHDAPNERMSTELVVDVPDHVLVSGNGKLISHTENDGRAKWHWLQSKPHVAYLVSLVGGTYERTELPAGPNGLPMTVWTRVGKSDDARETFARTGAMVACFERAFGTAYPWDRYDQLCARSFQAGGMENTSATTLFEGALLDVRSRAERDMDSLIAHELCHQWTGDYITCNNWNDLWLNEGWATYGQALWFECRDGPNGYFEEVFRDAQVAQRDRVESNGIAMCLNMHGPGAFGRAANPYPKGASILHMMREMIGDELFFRGVHLYMNRHGLSTAETSDFRHAMEDVSGLELGWFFDQWCDRSGCPSVHSTLIWDAAENALHLTITQTQPIDGMHPAFRAKFPVAISMQNGSTKTQWIDMRERTVERTIPLDAAPTMVEIDPRYSFLKTMKVDMPIEWTLAQIQHGSNVATRKQAIESLPADLTDQAVEVLVAVALDQSVWHSQRIDAVESLARGSSNAAKHGVRRVFDARVADGRVRASAVKALSVSLGVEALPDLVTVLQSDTGLGTRTAACNAIASWNLALAEHPELKDPLMRLCQEHTSGGGLEGAAMRACGKLRIAEAIPLVESRLVLGAPDRERAQAVEVLAQLCPAEGESRAAVIDLLIDLLEDQEQDVFDASGAALVHLKAEESRIALTRVAEEDESTRRRGRATHWLKELNPQ
ncbi:MAG: M1 family aminopeptidase [Planctomycetota bacterium]|nr:M1 family aminopeptidase [Planctomycetota bacterium]